ncbi:MAG: arylsulfatase [Bacteroidota bacterium]
MKFKPLFFYLSFFLFSSCQEVQQSEQISTETPPNIVLILADDLGYGELGAYGQKIIETPHLDELAANGMKFTQFYSGSAVCAPARCVLLTGQHTGHAHVRGNDEWAERGNVWSFEAMYENPTLEGQRPLPDSIITLAEQLQEKGYKTACVGKWGLGAPESEGTPNKQGFDFFYGYNCQRQAHTYYPTHLWKNEERVMLNNTLVPPHQAVSNDFEADETASYAPYNQADYAATLMQTEALQFVENQQDQPFFLYYATPIPHLALQAPERWVAHYQAKFGAEEPYTGKSYVPCQYPKATYAAMISYLDKQVGELVEKLKETGAYENTIIIFTSDNGPSFVEQVDIDFFESAEPLRNDSKSVKASLREGGIRVPLITSWPNHIEANSESDHIAAFWDFFPTICALTETDLPQKQAMDGISFAPTLLGKTTEQEQHDFLYWEFPEKGGAQAIRQGKWKAYRDQIKEEGDLALELYNLETDLKEQINVAKQFPSVAADLEAKMAASRYPSQTERWRMGVLDEN